MQLVELANEFHLTTADAIELCQAAGIDADSSATELTDTEADRWRDLAMRQRAWRESVAATEESVERENARALAEAGHGPPNRTESDFGPIPSAPWEPGAEPTALAPTLTAPAQPQVSALAALTMALGVASLIFPFLTGLGALLLAPLAKDRVRRSKGQLTGKGLAVAGQVVAVVGLTLWLGALALALYHDHQVSTGPLVADPQVDTGEISWDAIKPHDCVRIPRADLPVVQWQGIACDSPHESEVFATVKITNGTAEPYPGRDSLTPFATAECKKAFETYVGVPYDKSELKIGVYYPTGSNWTTYNDRTVGCIVYEDQYHLINGSLENAKR